MSNLKLPDMDYLALRKTLSPDGRTKKLAYHTWAGIVGEDVHVVYWATTIAVLSPWRVELNTGGWDTITTAMRLNRILQDNCGGAFRVGITRGQMVLRQRLTDELPFGRLAFELRAGVWTLARGV